MSTFLFYSSPPPTTSQPFAVQSTLFTPQAHRTNPQATWASFQPKSPSPLRASTNGINLMRRHHDSNVKYDMGSSDPVEPDVDPEQMQPHLETPYLGGASITDATAFSSPFGSDGTSNSNISEPSSGGQAPFQFQQRSRELSSRNQLSSRVSSNRTGRKADFLDRLRRSRRDQRDDRGIETFEKAEYWRERKQREETLKRQAQSEGIELEEEDLEELEQEQRPLSPIDEELEVDELVEAYYNPQQDLTEQQQDEFMDDSFEDDPVYEQAFIEVLSQQHVGDGCTKFEPGSITQNTNPSSEHDQLEKVQVTRTGTQDSTMDMSS